MPASEGAPRIDTLNAEKALVVHTIHGNVVLAGSPQSLIPHRPSSEWRVDSISRFHFSARATQLFGRDAELEQLREFCRAGANFRWWGITGKGGAGKSRLALELARELGNSASAWNWLFLGHGDILSSNIKYLASGWEPEQPTLLVVDYVAFVADQLRALLNSCAKNASAWRYPVRLLFLERTTEGGWHDRLSSSLSNEDKNRIFEARHSSDYLTLEHFPAEAAQQLVEEVLQRYGVHVQRSSQRSIEGLLRRLDIEHRPLFALFLADAIASYISRACASLPALP